MSDDAGFFRWRDRKYRDLRSIALDERNREKRIATRAHVYALEFPFSVIVGAVLGTLADKKLAIAPWGFWLGLAFGIAAGVRAVLRLIAFQRQNDVDDSEAADVRHPGPEAGPR